MRVSVDPADLRDLVCQVVRETIAELGATTDRLPTDRIGFPEREAAQLLGVASHVLRDARRRGEIQGRRVGRSIVYSREALVAFLAETD